MYRSDGTLYFTDPPFGLPDTFEDPEKELAFSGVFRVSVDGADLARERRAWRVPTAWPSLPMRSYLYVGNWDLENKVVMRYEVAADGSLSGGEVFYDMTDAPGEDALDGLKVDEAGNVYACGPGGVWILSPEGERLALLEAPGEPAQPRLGRRGRPHTLHHGPDQHLPHSLRIPGIRPQ